MATQLLQPTDISWMRDMQARHKTWILGNEPDIGSTSTDPVEAATFTQRWRLWLPYLQ